MGPAASFVFHIGYCRKWRVLLWVLPQVACFTDIFTYKRGFPQIFSKTNTLKTARGQAQPFSMFFGFGIDYAHGLQCHSSFDRPLAGSLWWMSQQSQLCWGLSRCLSSRSQLAVGFLWVAGGYLIDFCLGGYCFNLCMHQVFQVIRWQIMASAKHIQTKQY